MWRCRRGAWAVRWPSKEEGMMKLTSAMLTIWRLARALLSWRRGRDRADQAEPAPAPAPSRGARAAAHRAAAIDDALRSLVDSQKTRWRLRAGLRARQGSLFRRLRPRGPREQQADGARHPRADLFDDQARHGRGADAALRARQVRARRPAASSTCPSTPMSRCTPESTRMASRSSRRRSARSRCATSCGIRRDSQPAAKTRPRSALCTAKSIRARFNNTLPRVRAETRGGAAGLSTRHALAVFRRRRRAGLRWCRRSRACPSTSSSSCTSSGRWA